MYTVITRYIETIISYTNLKINFLQFYDIHYSNRCAWLLVRHFFLFYRVSRETRIPIRLLN